MNLINPDGNATQTGGLIHLLYLVSCSSGQELYLRNNAVADKSSFTWGSSLFVFSVSKYRLKGGAPGDGLEWFEFPDSVSPNL